MVKYLHFSPFFESRLVQTFPLKNSIPSWVLQKKIFCPQYCSCAPHRASCILLTLVEIYKLRSSISIECGWCQSVSLSVQMTFIPPPWKIFLEQPRVYPAIPILISRERGIDEKQKYKNVHFKVTLQVAYNSGHYRKLFSLFKLNNMAAPFNDLFLRSRYNSTNQIKMFMFPFEHPTNFVCQQLPILNVSRCYFVRKISPHVNDVTTPFMTSENISHLAN